MRWFDGAMVLSLTHHQSSESSTVSDGLTARTMQRANDPAHAVQYTGNWQIRVDTDRNAPVDTWRTEQAGGPLTVWFPEHRVFGDGAAAGPLARRPASTACRCGASTRSSIRAGCWTSCARTTISPC